MNKYLQVAILAVLAGVALYFIPHQAKAPVVDSFQACVQAGGTVTNGICTSPTGTCCFIQPQANPDVIVDLPQPNTIVTSPLTVKGQAVGSWYFEANLPVILKDGDGNVMAQKGFHALGDWTTTDYVGFNDTLTFTLPATQTGTLEIHNDNPSGDPTKDKVFSVPVKFW